MVVVFLAAGAAAGLVLGLFGAGGTIVALPALLYLAGLGPHLAIGTNALGVAAIAVALLAWRIRAQQIRLQDGAMFALPGLVGIGVGARLGLAVDGSRLVFLLGFVVFLVAAWMAYLALRLAPADAPRSPATARVPSPTRGRIARIGSTAVAVGGTAGFFGIGGGFLVVPGLAWAGRVELRDAARSGLLPIAAFAALIGAEYLANGSVNLPDAGLMLLGGMAGGAGGIWLAGRVPRRAFQLAFAGFLVLIGILMIAH
jgi:uncharacterized membrane protein YfcA